MSEFLYKLSIEGKKTGAKEEKKKGKKDVEEEAHKEELDKIKNPSSSYIFYSNEMVPKLKADRGISHRDAMKACGELWGKLTDNEKKKYDDLH